MDNKIEALIVDDDLEFIEDFIILLPEDIVCYPASTASEAFDSIEKNDISLVFLDVDLGTETSGLDVLKNIRKSQPHLPVIMITADHSIETVVQSMRNGAVDYVGKSPDMGKLKLSIEKALSSGKLHKKIELLESELKSIIGDMVGESESIQKIKEEMLRLSKVNSNVLITGQSGTGKELVARGIHKLSENRKEPFIAVNCAALSKDLFESELFGHEKGAFTGATSRRIGKFQLVESGTLFLDEITEIPIELQAKLLRVLQEREYERVGGNGLLTFKGRLMASSNRDINKAIEEGNFRQDLYYRLNVTNIHLPPLSERGDDIRLLSEYFLKLKSREMKKRIEGISDEAMSKLLSHNWPGNVRELANYIENAVVHCDGDTLESRHFDQIRFSAPKSLENYEEAKKQFLAEFQYDYISSLLKKNSGNISQTARDMDISRQGLIKIMKACGLNPGK